MLDAGKLRHRVTIQRNEPVQDSETGDMTDAWVEFATVWAQIAPLSAKEMIAAQSENSKIMARIVIRYRSDITSSMRIYHAAKDMYYNIEGILSDLDSGLEYITMPVSEGTRYKEDEFLS